MKLVKSYTAKIDGNTGKIRNLHHILHRLEEISNHVFSKGYEYWFDFNTMYADCRKLFSDINSKILQNFLQFYRPMKGRKMPKSVIKSSIILDYQNFNLVFDPDTKYSNWWLRFGRRNYPLKGKRILERIKDVSGVKECRIFIRNSKLYCKLTSVQEVSDPIATDNPIGIDLNTQRIASSSNKIYQMKRWFHRKRESKKGNQKDSLQNCTKNHIHQVTNQIIEDLIFSGSKVLVLEDLTNLRKSSSRKNKTSKGKTMNFIVNNSFPFSMFRNILSYKCLENGIQLKLVAAGMTSKLCSRCGSDMTLRKTQSRLTCCSCHFDIDADLNAARNILSRYTESNG